MRKVGFAFVVLGLLWLGSEARAEMWVIDEGKELYCIGKIGAPALGVPDCPSVTIGYPALEWPFVSFQPDLWLR